MNSLLIFAAVLSAGAAQWAMPYGAWNGWNGAVPMTYGAMAAPLAYGAPAVAAVAAPHSFSRRFQTQDELGRATFGHEQLDQSHSAVRDAFGNVAGGYSYVSPEGKVITAKYTAGVNGVQVASNALPVAPVDTNVAPVFTAVGPAPVQPTAEVRAATEKHLAALAEAERASREKRSLLAPSLYAAPAAAGYPAELTETILNPGHATAYRVDPIMPLAFRRKRSLIAPSVYATSAAAGFPAELTETILNPGHATAYRVDPIF